jgi:hypothetical protein
MRNQTGKALFVASVMVVSLAQTARAQYVSPTSGLSSHHPMRQMLEMRRGTLPIVETFRTPFNPALRKRSILEREGAITGLRMLGAVAGAVVGWVVSAHAP